MADPLDLTLPELVQHEYDYSDPTLPRSHCSYCGEFRRVVKDDVDLYICASCMDADNSSNLEDYAKTLTKKFEALKQAYLVIKKDKHFSDQAASENADWFCMLVSELSTILKCENKPSVIVQKVTELNSMMEGMKTMLLNSPETRESEDA